MSHQTFRMRALFSVLTFISFIVLLLTGIGLFVAPHDHVADWLSWTWMGMDQDVFAELHITFGLAFFISALAHMFYNIKPLVSYLNKPVEKKSLLTETSIAVLFSVVLMVGTLAGFPGPAHVIEFGEKLQASWAVGYPEAPIANAESLTIEQLGRLLDIDPQVILAKFEKMGIHSFSRESVIEDIAEANDIPPYRLISAIP